MATHPKTSTGVGRGGRRSNSGRKPGSHNKRSEFLIRRAEADDLELPVPRLLRRMNDKSLPENYRDSLAMAAAPYFSARLASTTAKVQFLGPEEMSDQQLQEWIDRARTAVQREPDLVTSKPRGHA
jgi:hypothetical protein